MNNHNQQRGYQQPTEEENPSSLSSKGDVSSPDENCTNERLRPTIVIDLCGDDETKENRQRKRPLPRLISLSKKRLHSAECSINEVYDLTMLN